VSTQTRLLLHFKYARVSSSASVIRARCGHISYSRSGNKLAQLMPTWLAYRISTWTVGVVECIVTYYRRSLLSQQPGWNPEHWYAEDTLVCQWSIWRSNTWASKCSVCVLRVNSVPRPKTLITRPRSRTKSLNRCTATLVIDARDEPWWSIKTSQPGLLYWL